MNKKIGISGTAGALGILVVWGLSTMSVEVPTEVAQAISTLIASLFTWMGYKVTK